MSGAQALAEVAGPKGHGRARRASISRADPDAASRGGRGHVADSLTPGDQPLSQMSTKPVGVFHRPPARLVALRPSQ